MLQESMYNKDMQILLYTVSMYCGTRNLFTIEPRIDTRGVQCRCEWLAPCCLVKDNFHSIFRIDLELSVCSARGEVKLKLGLREFAATGSDLHLTTFESVSCTISFAGLRGFLCFSVGFISGTARAALFL